MVTDEERAVTALLRGAPIEISDALIACAREHRVHLLVAVQVPRGSEDRVRAALAVDLREAAAVDAAREIELTRVLDAFAAAGVRAIVLKGAALGYTHYPRPELRPRLDTDLLIPADARERACRVLDAIGYTRATETDGDLCVSQMHWHRVDASGIAHALDLHWRISNVLALADVLAYEEVAQAAVAIPRLGPAALAPCAAHALLVACLHRVAHHHDSGHLLWLYDIALVADGLDADAIAEFTALARRHRVRGICAASLRRAGECFGGAAVDLARQVAPADGVREPSAALLAERLRLVDLLTADMRALDGWGKRWRLVREHVFPSREYMFARYGTRQPLSLPWLYLHRFARGAPKWFRP